MSAKCVDALLLAAFLSGAVSPVAAEEEAGNGCTTITYFKCNSSSCKAYQPCSTTTPDTYTCTSGPATEAWYSRVNFNTFGCEA